MGDYIKGFALVHRQILEGKYHDNLIAMGLWTYILLSANWKEKYFQGELIPRGSYITSISGMATQFGMDRKTVRKYLENFEKDGMICLKRDNKKTIIEVVNYDKYQDLSLWVGQQTGQQDGQQSGQQTGQQDGHNLKQVKQVKQVNINTSSPTQQSETWFEEFWNAYPKKVEKKKTRIKFLQIIKTEQQFRELMNGLNLTVVAKYQAEPDLKYILNPLTFLNGERWTDEPYANRRKQTKVNSIPDYMQRQKNGVVNDKPATKEALERAIALQKSVCSAPLPDYMQRQKEGTLQADPVTQETLNKLEELEQRLGGQSA